MANGCWGGRFPLENLICSKTVLMMLGYGVMRRRCINGLRKLIARPKVILKNTESTRSMLLNWLDQGCDRLNIGGGPKNLKGFVNVDFVAYPDVERLVVADIRDLAFVPDGRVAHVHSNHLLEHLSSADVASQFREWHRILREEGLLTIRCPNALGAAYGFWFEPVIESHKDEFIELGFPADEDFGVSADRWVHKDLFGLVHWFYGDAGNIANQHLSQITPSMLRGMLESNGFDVLKMTEPEAINIAIVARKGVRIG